MNKKFAMPAQNAYSGVNINTAKRDTQTPVQQTAQTPVQGFINNKINIAQILKDF